jgi:hypothetical protein
MNEEITKCVEILQPINDLIVKFQNDSVPISEIFHEMTKLRELAANSNWRNKKDITNLINDRFHFIYADCHGLAYLLDPRYMGDKLEPEVSEGCKNWMLELSQNNENIVLEHAKYVQMISDVRISDAKSYNSIMYKKVVDSTISVQQYWKNISGSFPVLSSVAIALFTLVCSSAASERNFSTFGFIHSKLRNQLKNDRLKKMIFVFANSKCLRSIEEEDIDVSELEEGFEYVTN